MQYKWKRYTVQGFERFVFFIRTKVKEYEDISKTKEISYHFWFLSLIQRTRMRKAA